LHGAAVKEQLLSQGRFPGVRMRDNGKGAPFLYFLCDIHRAQDNNTPLENPKS
jgi:hypothetical protein